MSEGNWHRVATTGDVAEEEPIRVQVGEEDIAIYNVAGDFHATSNICTHAYASMVDGFQEGDEIECPLHDGRFNIKTGRIKAGEAGSRVSMTLNQSELE